MRCLKAHVDRYPEKKVLDFVYQSEKKTARVHQELSKHVRAHGGFSRYINVQFHKVSKIAELY